MELLWILEEEAVRWRYLVLLFYLGEGEDMREWDMVMPARLDVLELSQLRLWCAECPGWGVTGGI